MVDLLRLPGLRATGEYVEHGDLIVEVEGTVGNRLRCSLFCQFRKMGRAQPARYRDHPIQGQPTWLEIKRQRFQCTVPGCGKTPYEELPDIDTDRRLTFRFRRKLEEDAVAVTFTRAAEINGVEDTLVRRVFAEFAAKKLEGYRIRLPRVLGIDEKVIKGVACLTLGDIEAGAMLDMRPSRIDKDIRPYFREMPGRDGVEVVCQDMWRGYRQITKDLFPRAVTVIDKFHAVRMADWGVEIVRKALYSGLAAADRKSLKRSNKLLKVRLANASDEHAESLMSLFGLYPVLLEAYLVRERFYSIYENQTRAEAEAAMTAWREAVPSNLRRPFKALITAIGNWRPYMLNYFDHRYTNSYVERLNGLIDTINREGTGLPFETLRAKAMLKYSVLREEPVYKRVPRTERLDDDVVGFIGLFDSRPPEMVRKLVGTRVVLGGIDLSTFEADFLEGLFAA